MLVFVIDNLGYNPEVPSSRLHQPGLKKGPWVGNGFCCFAQGYSVIFGIWGFKFGWFFR